MKFVLFQVNDIELKNMKQQVIKSLEEDRSDELKDLKDRQAQMAVMHRKYGEELDSKLKTLEEITSMLLFLPIRRKQHTVGTGRPFYFLFLPGKEIKTRLEKRKIKNAIEQLDRNLLIQEEQKKKHEMRQLAEERQRIARREKELEDEINRMEFNVKDVIPLQCILPSPAPIPSPCSRLPLRMPVGYCAPHLSCCHRCL